MYLPSRRSRDRGSAGLGVLSLLAIAALAGLVALGSYRAATHAPTAPPPSTASPAPPASTAAAPSPAAARSPAATPSPAAAASSAIGASSAAAPRTIGYLDVPAGETTVSTRLSLSGWALDPAGIRGVEVRVDGRTFAARYGTVRDDVAKVKPGFPDSPAAGFEFERDFADLPAMRHEVIVSAIAKDGRRTMLGRRSLVSPAAMSAWTPLLDARPGLARSPFTFLMMTSGVGPGGAAEIDTEYRPYLSRTMRVGMAVPILYMRSTRGASHDWEFDPAFDVSRKCGKRAVVEDNLDTVIRHAVSHALPVQFILNGGIWADASCETPEWDLTDHLEQDDANVQWTQDDRTFPDDYLKGLAGSTDSPELARSLTYHVYARTVRDYKRRNLQAAAARIARFAREYPDLFVGVVLDSDVYMNPFFLQKEFFDYNPGMLRQFREWLRGTGPYAGKGGPGVPDLSGYRRLRIYTLSEVNAIARRAWRSWDEVDPPRRFPGSMRDPDVRPGETLIWDDPWWHLWEEFRKHVVALHYDELAAWAYAAGLPAGRVHSAQGFLKPDPGLTPFALRIDSHGQNYESSGVSVAGAIPKGGHLGAVIYGEAARNEVVLENGRSLFANFARMDPGWAIVEHNPTDLKRADLPPKYAHTYATLRDAFNYGASSVSAMAWNGSNGLFADSPGYVAYTAWRNTPGEDAMRDFLVTHANVPRGALLWTFGSAREGADDGWRAEVGQSSPGNGHLSLALDGARATVVSPPDQVIRTRAVDLLVLRTSGAPLRSSTVGARLDERGDWQAVGSGDARVPLRWPAQWVSRGAIAVQLRVGLEFAPGAREARLERVLLYPASPAAGATVR